uniref:Uncharacterized protein n=1 Tax=Oryza barthii TaxID=65489 RepID=A0A0D3FF77_9ORYZ
MFASRPAVHPVEAPPRAVRLRRRRPRRHGVHQRLPFRHIVLRCLRNRRAVCLFAIGDGV